MDIYKLFDKILDEYGVVRYGDKNILIFLRPYNPRIIVNPNFASIDSYYFASNEMYKLSKTICSELRQGGIDARIYSGNDYKRLARQALNVNVGKNTLCYHSEYGSRFVIGAIEFYGDFVEKIKTATDADMCGECKKCVLACPTGAICDSGVNRALCLRQKIEDRNFNERESSVIGNSILGCDICQRVCPKNRKTDFLSDYDNRFYLPNLLDSVLRNDIKWLGELIGTNYARKNRLLYMIVNAMGNSGNKEYIEVLKSLSTDAEMLNLDRAVSKLWNI